jgi:hypothetical protein
MGIGYNLNIPAAPHAPSTDQPNMLTNNNNIATYVAVDHVPFNTSGSGQHEQVTFNANNVPSVPTVPPVLFTNVQDGAGNTLPGALAQLFFYTGAHDKSKDQYVSQANGSVLLPGGIILKWGSSAVTNSSQLFPVAFPNNAFSMLITSSDAALGSPLKVTALSSTAFTVTRSGVGATGYYYLAIGN